MLHILEQDNLDEIVNNHERVVAIFGASWCGNCRLLKPHITKHSEKDTETHYVYVDAEKYENSRKSVGVKNLPTTATFLNGVPMNKTTSPRLHEVVKMIESDFSSELVTMQKTL